MGKIKFGLALGSGGSRGVAHIGVLRALEEHGIRPDFVSGSSMGSVVGACYCSGLSVDYMLEELKNLKLNDLFDLDFAPLKNMGFLKADKLEALLNRLFGDKTFADCEIPFCCSALDLMSGNDIIFKEGRLAPAVQASSSIPLIFRPLKIDNMLLIDGGTTNRLPMQAVRDLGADVVVTVDVLGTFFEGDVKNIFSFIIRMMNVVDYRSTQLKLKLGESDLLLIPNLGNMSQFYDKDMERAVDIGYKCVNDNIDKIKDLLQI